jgi:imidazolonepropionase-like amidohydrolase
VPNNNALKREVAAGITTVLYIPGSGTNMSGSGVLLKTGLARYEEMVVRDPGSLKIAQGDNPTGWAYGMGRSMMNWNIKSELARGLAYARARKAERANGAADAVERNPRFDIFEALLDKRTQVSTHTQLYVLVLNTLTMIRRDFGLDVYIDHGEWLGYKATALANELGVSAIVGPREIDAPSRGRFDTDGAIVGCAAGYQKAGMPLVGFNTDAPVVPGDELPLQAAMAARYGFDNSAMQVVRGLTIVPATVSGIAKRVGSLEAGKDADIVVLDGDPADPRTRIERVFIEGHAVYEISANGAPVH